MFLVGAHTYTWTCSSWTVGSLHVPNTCFPLFCLFGNEDLLCIFFTGLNKELRKMLSEHAEFKALNLKDILSASDGTKKVNTILLLLPRINPL